MKVADLKMMLDQYPNDLDVVLSKDTGGLRFSPAFSVNCGFYEPESDYLGSYASVDVQGMESDEPVKNNAVCIWP